MAQVSPFFRSILTDLSGPMINHQLLGKCAKQEMDFMDCLEGYGWDRAATKCTQLLEDFKECQTNRKQFLRFMALRKERNKQIACKQLTSDKQYISPRADSF